MHRALLWLLWLTLPVAAAEHTFRWDASQTGRQPEGFSSTRLGEGRIGSWKILVDDDNPGTAEHSSGDRVISGRPVLAQTSEDMTDERFPLLIYDEEVFGDFTLTTRLKLVSGTLERMAGIAFRIQDPTNYYVVRASGLGSNVRFYKVQAGKRTAPLGPELPVASDEWHTLEVSCKGNEIRVAFDGKDIMPPLVDNTFSAGKIGFWTKSDSVSYFGETKIVYRPRVPFAQTLVDGTLKKYSRLEGLKLYVLDKAGMPRVIASGEASELKSAGGEYETSAIKGGTSYVGKSQARASVVIPLRDRNGEPIAAVRVVMKSFPGQTDRNALARATPVARHIQKQVQTLEQLLD